MGKSMASLLGGEISMRERVLKATQHNHYSVLQNRLVEENYSVKITELAGKSFRPLVGFTVTVEEILPVAQARQRKVDDVVSFDYVEYGTGYRLRVYMTVELDEDYLPLGVELKAFRDAVVVQAEQLLNACGYTFNETPIMGLRNVTNVDHTNDTRFVEMFNGDRALRNAVRHVLNETQELSFNETADDFRFTADNVKVLKIEAHGHDALLVHVDLLGGLAELDSRRIFREMKYKEAKGQPTKIVYNYAIDVPDYSMRPDREYGFHRLEIFPLGQFPLETIVQGQTIIQVQPKDWKNRQVHYPIAVERPEDWRIVTVDRPYNGYSSRESKRSEFTLELIDDLNRNLPALLRAPRKQEETDDVSEPRRSFRRWVADGIRAIANWFDK